MSPHKIDLPYTRYKGIFFFFLPPTSLQEWSKSATGVTGEGMVSGRVYPLEPGYTGYFYKVGAYKVVWGFKLLKLLN